MNLGISKRDPGWLPYVWLAYLIFFLWDPVMYRVGWREWTFTAVGLLAFLCFYFPFFLLCRPWNLICVGGIAALGVLYAPYNAGAACFFIYACSMAPFALETELAAAGFIAAFVGIAALEWWLLHVTNGFLFPATFLSTFIGAGNVYFAQRNRNIEKLRRANEEIEHLAKVAERERIARDLHDVLGHTLSLITLKSELAGKLIDRDPAQAKAEIRDVEQTARTALSEVRQAIGGYRSKGLTAEIRQAKSTLETAGLKVELQSTSIELPATQESVLALSLREAVTNVVRHARATRCSVRLERSNSHCRLEIVDDGRGGHQIEGNGLRGMRERVEALGGQLRRETTQGTRLEIMLPFPAEQEKV